MAGWVVQSQRGMPEVRGCLRREGWGVLGQW